MKLLLTLENGIEPAVSFRVLRAHAFVETLVFFISFLKVGINHSAMMEIIGDGSVHLFECERGKTIGLNTLRQRPSRKRYTIESNETRVLLIQ
jgi:hypothetical protein